MRGGMVLVVNANLTLLAGRGAAGARLTAGSEGRAGDGGGGGGGGSWDTGGRAGGAGGGAGLDLAWCSRHELGTAGGGRIWRRRCFGARSPWGRARGRKEPSTEIRVDDIRLVREHRILLYTVRSIPYGSLVFVIFTLLDARSCAFLPCLTL
jgi:hypothetical protein